LDNMLGFLPKEAINKDNKMSNEPMLCQAYMYCFFF